jgi:hypothetical protein
LICAIRDKSDVAGKVSGNEARNKKGLKANAVIKTNWGPVDDEKPIFSIGKVVIMCVIWVGWLLLMAKIHVGGLWCAQMRHPS